MYQQSQYGQNQLMNQNINLNQMQQSYRFDPSENNLYNTVLRVLSFIEPIKEACKYSPRTNIEFTGTFQDTIKTLIRLNQIDYTEFKNQFLLQCERHRIPYSNVIKNPYYFLNTLLSILHDENYSPLNPTILPILDISQLYVNFCLEQRRSLLIQDQIDFTYQEFIKQFPQNSFISNSITNVYRAEVKCSCSNFQKPSYYFLPYNIFEVNLMKYNTQQITLQELTDYATNNQMEVQMKCLYCLREGTGTISFYEKPNKTIIFQINNPQSLIININWNLEQKVEIKYLCKNGGLSKKDYFLKAGIFFRRSEGRYYCICSKKENDVNSVCIFDDRNPNPDPSKIYQDDLLLIVLERSEELKEDEFNTGEKVVKDSTFSGGGGIYETFQGNNRMNNGGISSEGGIYSNFEQVNMNKNSKNSFTNFMPRDNTIFGLISNNNNMNSGVQQQQPQQRMINNSEQSKVNIMSTRENDLYSNVKMRNDFQFNAFQNRQGQPGNNMQKIDNELYSKVQQRPIENKNYPASFMVEPASHNNMYDDFNSTAIPRQQINNNYGQSPINMMGQSPNFRQDQEMNNNMMPQPMNNNIGGHPMNYNMGGQPLNSNQGQQMNYNMMGHQQNYIGNQPPLNNSNGPQEQNKIGKNFILGSHVPNA